MVNIYLKTEPAGEVGFKSQLLKSLTLWGFFLNIIHIKNPVGKLPKYITENPPCGGMFNSI